MKHILLFLLPAVLIFAGCRKHNPHEPQSEFIDYGYVSSSESGGPDRMLYYKGEIFVATDDGVWKIRTGTKQWKQAGLPGKKISCLYSHPGVEGSFYAGIIPSGSTEKSLFISRDAGQTWEAAASPVFDDFNNSYETYYDIKARPGYPDQLFANLSGATIAISKDRGLTWHRQNYAEESYFGDYCVIHIPEDRPNEIYQGAEAPLDQAWLGKYVINATDPVRLGDLQQIIGGNYEWSNRRPNTIEGFSSNPGILYVGMEGALSKVEGSTWKYLFKGEEAPDNFPYTYVKGIWVDPTDNNHIIFGGGVNGNNTTLSLYETYDEGKTIVHIKDKLGMQDPDIIDIIATNTYPALLIRDNGNKHKLRLMVYRF